MTNLQCCHSKLDIMHDAFMPVCVRVCVCELVCMCVWSLFLFYTGLKRSGIIYPGAFWEYVQVLSLEYDI